MRSSRLLSVLTAALLAVVGFNATALAQVALQDTFLLGASFVWDNVNPQMVNRYDSLKADMPFNALFPWASRTTP
jgi:hypothetical protein